MKTGLLAVVAGMLLSGQALTCDMHGTSGIVENNDMWIGVNDKSANKVMTEERFYEVIAGVEAIYAPVIAAMGKTLQVEKRWDDGTVNAYAQQIGNTWKVSMFGGLARHATITEDAFATVVCHEIGHHIGGMPKKKSWWGPSWASNEGQADYFGTSKCFRKYVEADDNVAIMKDVELPAVVIEKCAANFTNEAEIAICHRGALAGLSLANLFNALANSNDELKYETPDPRVVTSTNDNHPAAQCRLDTYFNGSLCDKSAYDDVSDTDALVGTCNRVDGYSDGVRPLCWYKPAN